MLEQYWEGSRVMSSHIPPCGPPLNPVGVATGKQIIIQEQVSDCIGKRKALVTTEIHSAKESNNSDVAIITSYIKV